MTTILAQTYHSTIEACLWNGTTKAVIKRCKNQSDPRTRRRFLSEVAALRRVGNHGNITQLLSYDQHYLTLTLRHEQGQSLDKFLDSSQRCTIPPSSAILVWKQVTSAVSHLHSLNLVHDDIKPDNIVWSPEDHHAVLIDFGAALDLDVLPKDYFNPSGTPSYAPPEFLLKRKGPEADVWELGIVMLFALRLVRLPDGNWLLPAVWDEGGDVEMRRWLAKVEELRKKCLLDASGTVGRDTSGGGADIPPLTYPLLARMLDADPGQRVSTPELLRELEEIAHGMK